MELQQRWKALRLTWTRCEEDGIDVLAAARFELQSLPEPLLHLPVPLFALVEVQQAGLVAITGFEEDERRYLLGSQCMTILFPYAREVISDLSTRGGFPPVILSPVNFDALYQQHMQQQQAETEEAEATIQ